MLRNAKLHKVHACAALSFTRSAAKHMACPQCQHICMSGLWVFPCGRVSMCSRRSSDQTCCRLLVASQAVFVPLPTSTDASVMWSGAKAAGSYDETMCLDVLHDMVTVHTSVKALNGHACQPKVELSVQRSGVKAVAHYMSVSVTATGMATVLTKHTATPSHPPPSQAKGQISSFIVRRTQRAANLGVRAAVRRVVALSRGAAPVIPAVAKVSVDKGQTGCTLSLTRDYATSTLVPEQPNM
eukprot:6196583-Pleurochrysis_carterae.AAC.1